MSFGMTMTPAEREQRIAEIREINDQERWEQMHSTHHGECWRNRDHGRCREAFLLGEIERLKKRKRR
jgi:hypothetical protein